MLTTCTEAIDGVVIVNGRMWEKAHLIFLRTFFFCPEWPPANHKADDPAINTSNCRTLGICFLSDCIFTAETVRISSSIVIFHHSPVTLLQRAYQLNSKDESAIFSNYPITYPSSSVSISLSKSTLIQNGCPIYRCVERLPPNSARHASCLPRSVLPSTSPIALREVRDPFSSCC